MGNHTDRAHCAASAIIAQPKKSTADKRRAAEKRSARVDKTGRQANPGRPFIRLYSWLLSSPEWLDASCADRAALMAVMSRETGWNNGTIRMGARRLAAIRGTAASKAADRLRSLAKAGLIVRTNTPTKGPHATREAEWLLPFYGNKRDKTAPADRWKAVSAKKDARFGDIPHDVMATPAWQALSDAAQVLFGTIMCLRAGRQTDTEESIAALAKRISVSEDTAHRAMRDLEAKGFVMRHRTGRALVGKRTTATYSVDHDVRKPPEGPREPPRRRFDRWQEGMSFAPPPAPQPARKPRPDPVVTDDTTDTLADTATDPEDIDTANPRSLRVVEYLMAQFINRTFEVRREPFTLNKAVVQSIILRFAKHYGDPMAVPMARSAIFAAIESDRPIRDYMAEHLRSLEAGEPVKAAAPPTPTKSKRKGRPAIKLATADKGAA